RTRGGVTVAGEAFIGTLVGEMCRKRAAERLRARAEDRGATDRLTARDSIYLNRRLKKISPRQRMVVQRETPRSRDGTKEPFCSLANPSSSANLARFGSAPRPLHSSGTGLAFTAGR